MIDTLPLVWQVVIEPVSWQVGRASAAGAETSAITVKLAMISADLRRLVMCPMPLQAASTRYHDARTRARAIGRLHGTAVRSNGEIDELPTG